MNKIKLAISLLFVSSAALADVTVTFNNQVLGASGLMRDFFGQPLKNAEGGSTAYVAQLFLVDMTTSVGASANFRPFTTGSPGTWVGANRTIPGVNPGEAVQLVVGVWDSLKGSSVEAAFAAGGQAGWSAPFSYTQPATVTLPSDTYMSNFQGFQLNMVPEPSTYALAALGLGGLLFLRRKN